MTVTWKTAASAALLSFVLILCPSLALSTGGSVDSPASTSFYPARDAAADDIPQKSRMPCDAAYSTSCGRRNSVYLSSKVAAELTSRLDADGNISKQDLTYISKGLYNEQKNFYPFVAEKATGILVGHGADESFVGLTVEEVFSKIGLGFSDANRLNERLAKAADNGGGFVQYLWYDHDRINSKLAYVMPIGDRFYVGVGYQNQQLPPDLPCDHTTDSFCSINNARSLLGKTEFELSRAQSIEQFDEIIFRMSFDKEYRIDGGHYAFMYHYNGKMKSHPLLHDSFGKTLGEIFDDKGCNPMDGWALHQQLVDAAEGKNQGIVRYKWKDGPDEPAYTKIAFVTKITFEGENYFLGVGFTFARPPPMKGPLGEDCSHETNLPCSFRTVLDLSSHGFAHVISSPQTDPKDIFDAWTHDRRFFLDGYYLFAYSFDGVNVAHGLNPGFLGKTLQEIFDEIGISLNGTLLHETFRDAAINGNGYVAYNWMIPGVPNSNFVKISYIFRITIDGKDYYGGIGIKNQQREGMPNMSTKYRSNDGSLIACQPEHGFDCSEVNAQSILGQAIASLHLATSQAIVTTDGQQAQSVQEILDAITNQHGRRYMINDFHVRVFSEDGAECNAANNKNAHKDAADYDDDDNGNSGCLIADGGDADLPDDASRGSLLYKSWQQILDAQNVTSITGHAVHRKLVAAANKDGGYADYSIASKTYRAWAVRYRFQSRMFYVISQYDISSKPDTCKVCDSNFILDYNTDCLNGCETAGYGCSRRTESFCSPMVGSKGGLKLRDEPLILSIVSTVMAVLIGIIMICKFNSWRKSRDLQQMIQQAETKHQEELDQVANEMMANQLQEDIVKVNFDLPIMTIQDYHLKYELRHKKQSIWYWEENKECLQNRDPKTLLPNSMFVQYMPKNSSWQIERVYQQWKEGLRSSPLYEIDLTGRVKKLRSSKASSGLKYVLDFESMTQTNAGSGRIRKMHREEIPFHIDPQSLDALPKIPEDLLLSDDGGISAESECMLPVRQGQIIQITKRHETDDHWAYGNVAHDATLQQLIEEVETESFTLNAILAQALHDRPTSGWFPLTLTTPADQNVMKELVSVMGARRPGALSEYPSHWFIGPTQMNGNSRGDDASCRDMRFPVEPSSSEYQTVKEYFTHRLGNVYEGCFNITGIDRIQNLPLYRSYQMKKATVEARFDRYPKHRVNNTNTPAERRWLFHGTSESNIPKIIAQGFNPALSGDSNAEAYGKGTYQARDASYSIDERYAKPDKNNIRYIFMSLVVVGDWSVGSVEQRTPASNPNNPLENLDSTVDKLVDPEIFVAYSASQIYPEYLVAVKPVSA
mmetsp:Transcript_1463/g.3620  ORF Transcript_1463/g.3620 Transcript_1463/m.3620 type:complete len:1329 (-) Transcript_1463:150-4136(-)